MSYELRYFNGKTEKVLAKNMADNKNVFTYIKYFMEKDLNKKVGNYIVIEEQNYTKYLNGNNEFRLYKTK